MELVAPKKNLLRLLQRCQGVADKKSTMPVLANVHLDARGHLLHVAATDLFLSVSGSLEAEIAKPGAVAVPARDLFERVRHMPDGPIQFAVGEGSATTLKALGTARRYTLHGLPGRDFPPLPQPTEGAASFELPVEALSQLIARTHFSISTDETRAYLNSALFECRAGRVRMVTTDGHRLSKAEIVVDGLKAETTMLVPHKAVVELRKLLDEVTEERGDTPVSILQAGPSAFFRLLGVQLSVKLVDAQFPPYDAVIPALTDRAVRTPRVPFGDALRAVSLAASERTGGVKLALSKGTLRISSESPESGAGFDEITVDYTGPELAVGFNAKYILDVLGAIDDDEVTLGLSGELDPAVLKPAGSDPAGTPRDDYIAVVMPMRI
jgi:DNA polymerase-3 subunit beta